MRGAPNGLDRWPGSSGELRILGASSSTEMAGGGGGVAMRMSLPVALGRDGEVRDGPATAKSGFALVSGPA